MLCVILDVSETLSIRKVENGPPNGLLLHRLCTETIVSSCTYGISKGLDHSVCRKKSLLGEQTASLTLRIEARSLAGEQVDWI